MNKLALALAFSAIGATAASAQIIDLNTGTSISTNRTQDGTWRREGNTDIYTRTRVDSNGDRVVDRARRDALGNFIVIDSRIVNRNDDNRGRNDNTWKRSDNENRVYVRTRYDANGNRIIEKARRDSNGNYIVFDSRVVSRNDVRRDHDRDDDGRDDRWENGKSKDGKWKNDKNGKKWDKAVNKGSRNNNGKGKGKNK